MQIPAPEIENFFAVPISRVTFPDYEPFCDELEALFLSKESEGDRYRHQKHIDTMHGDLFESRFDLFRWPDEPVRKLASGCHQALAQQVQQTSGYDADDMALLRFDYHAWFMSRENTVTRGYTITQALRGPAFFVSTLVRKYQTDLIAGWFVFTIRGHISTCTQTRATGICRLRGLWAA